MAYDSHPELLLDPDVEQRRIVRPVHTDPYHIFIVAFGAFFGTLARYGIGVALPSSDGGWPVNILLVNITGAFALGLLMETLINRGPDEGSRQLIRLGLGTGFLGAFTTYSSLAVGADMLVRNNHAGIAALYVLATILGGAAATAFGIQIATFRNRGSKT